MTGKRVSWVLGCLATMVWWVGGQKVHAVMCTQPMVGNTCIVCEGNSNSPGIDFDGTGVDENAGIQKVIRNCTFKDDKANKIKINRAKNVLIENSKFINLRSNQAGRDLGFGVTVLYKSHAALNLDRSTGRGWRTLMPKKYCTSRAMA